MAFHGISIALEIFHILQDDGYYEKGVYNPYKNGRKINGVISPRNQCLLIRPNFATTDRNPLCLSWMCFSFPVEKCFELVDTF